MNNPDNTTDHLIWQNESTLAELAKVPIWAARGKDAPDTERGKFDRRPINPKSGGNASNCSPATWGTRSAAQKRAAKFDTANQPGVGIMLGSKGLPNGWTLAGVDLDGCRDPKTCAVAPWAAEVVRRLGSYAEVSPSGTGLHILFMAQTAEVEALRAAGLIADWGRSFAKGGHCEIATFFGGKFLTVTDQPHGDEFSIRPVALALLQWLLGDYGPNWASAEPSAPDHDEFGSGHAWRFALALFRQGLSRDEVAEAMAEDSSEAGQWWSRVTERERNRVLDRAAAQIEGERISDDQLDDLSEMSIEDLLGPEPTPDRLTFLRPSDCAALPPRDYLVKSLIASGQVGCIFGEPGAGKSLLAPWLGYAVAQGSDLFGLRTRQGGVFYVACEDESGMAGRIMALRDHLDDADDFRLVQGVSDLFTPGQIAGKGSPDLEALRKAVKRRKPRLVIIDTLAMAMPGVEENDAAGMNRVVQIGKALARFGAAVIFVHHGTKAEGNTPRGHSVFNGALDFSIMVKAADQAGIVRGVIKKNRNGPPDLDIAFRIGSRHVGHDIDGEPISAPICEPCDPLSHDGLPPLPKAAQAALDHLWEIGKGEWVEELAWRDGCTNARNVSPSDVLKSRQTAYRRQVSVLVEREEVEFADDKFRPVSAFKGELDDLD